MQPALPDPPSLLQCSAWVSFWGALTPLVSPLPRWVPGRAVPSAQPQPGLRLHFPFIIHRAGNLSTRGAGGAGGAAARAPRVPTAFPAPGNPPAWGAAGKTEGALLHVWGRKERELGRCCCHSIGESRNGSGWDGHSTSPSSKPMDGTGVRDFAPARGVPPRASVAAPVPRSRWLVPVSCRRGHPAAMQPRASGAAQAPTRVPGGAGGR